MPAVPPPRQSSADRAATAPRTATDREAGYPGPTEELPVACVAYHSEHELYSRYYTGMPCYVDSECAPYVCHGNVAVSNEVTEPYGVNSTRRCHFALAAASSTFPYTTIAAATLPCLYTCSTAGLQWNQAFVQLVDDAGFVACECFQSCNIVQSDAVNAARLFEINIGVCTQPAG
ncbi:hypothetical protein DFJ74DRAFT_667765 [Hyaloraphidium curvatum]|nr:hypothetical protein DFJ74DRAFT_667765 [Hyaloraphidium curvatum]